MSVKELCRLLGYSKQAYYKRNKNLVKKRCIEEIVVGLINEKRKIWKRGSGRNLHKSLEKDFAEHNIKLGRDRFYDILRKNGLLEKKRKRKVTTTYSYHNFYKYPNLIKNIEPISPNKIIVSDITYIWLRESETFCYLFLTTDMYARMILGYCLSETLRAESAIKTIKMALRNMTDISDCIHHSDRGIQYCCYAYTDYLTKRGIKISMTENGDPLENSIAERINKTLKEEFTKEKQISFLNYKEAKKEISKIIEFYNNERPHRSIEMLTPQKAYGLKGKLNRKWKTYYKTNKNHKKKVMELL